MPAPPSSRSTPPNKPTQNKLHRPAQSSTTSHHRTLAHQVHSNQPSPSPSQINNPIIYTAPPPNPRPSSHRPSPSSSSFNSGTLSFPQPQIPSGGFGGRSSPYVPYSATSPSYSGPSQSFPPANWSPPGPPPPSQPQLYQPQPVSASQASPVASPTTKPSNGAGAFAQGASTVVQGLMDKLTLRR